MFKNLETAGHGYANADLKISLYARLHMKTIPRKFRILKPKNYRVIYP